MWPQTLTSEVAPACLFSLVSCHCPSSCTGLRHTGLFSNIPNTLWSFLPQGLCPHCFLFFMFHLVHSQTYFLPDFPHALRYASLGYILWGCSSWSSLLEWKHHEGRDHFYISIYSQQLPWSLAHSKCFISIHSMNESMQKWEDWGNLFCFVSLKLGVKNILRVERGFKNW